MDFGFPAMVALICLSADQAILLQTLSVCVIHECGHGIAMLLTGAGISEIHFHAAGICMTTGSCLLSNRKELSILFAGPAVNLLCAGILYFTGASDIVPLLHCAAGVFNLLPYRLLDGGAALQCLWDTEFSERIRKIFCLGISALFILVLLKCDIWNPCLFFMPLFLAASELPVDNYLQI